MHSELERMISISGDRARASADFSRFEESYARAVGRPFSWDAPAALGLARIFGNSSALAGRLIANPAWADEIAESPYANSRKPREAIARELAEITAGVGAEDAHSFDRALRIFKYREMTRLVARDLANEIDTREMLAEWSDVADALIDAAYSRAFDNTSRKLGSPLDAAGRPCTGAIIALGKLGGRELNLSSDVDVLVIYATDDGGAAAPGGDAITSHEFFVKLAAEFTRLLSAATPDGFVFRVDHELRPEGPQGPLANSLDAALRYYECFGRDWERQALIRARPVAGDIALGAQFVGSIRPFVYRRSISIGDISHMREMKERMAALAARRQEGFDIKHGSGGIREVEFLVQALQELHGGARPQVRRTNTFDAIEALAREELMHPYGSKLVSRAWAFLRRIENMLQVADDLQAHRMPSDEAGMRALARRMGYAGGDAASQAHAMRADLARHTRGVERLFRALFEADYDRLELDEAIQDNVSRATNEEEEADSLAWFKHHESMRLARLDIEGMIALPQLLKRLSLAADVVVKCAWEVAARRLAERHGVPRLGGGGSASFAIVGMGRLGSQEIDYGSDLDLCFLYSGAGSTDGKRPITNVEFFTKLAQRIISAISLSTRYGRAYAVDSELRPSGRQGTLVATLDSFAEYHMGGAQVWERLSLLKARAIAGEEPFLREARIALLTLAYRIPPPPADEMRAEIARLRERWIRERPARREGVFDIKTGEGGLSDLESVIQYHHLQNASHLETLWRQNTFDVLEALAQEGIIDMPAHDALLDHLTFYRRLLARLRLISKSAAGAIDLKAPYLDVLAMQMGFPHQADLISELSRRRAKVKGIYNSAIGPPVT